MDNSFLDKIRQIILNHLDDEKFDVSQLASEIGFSKSQIFRKVKSLTNRSVNQFIKETRLQEAVKLILNSDLHVAEISYKVGFSSPSYFNKCFSKYYGITPGEYKDKSIEKPLLNKLEGRTFKSRFKKLYYFLYFLGAILLLVGIFSLIKSKRVTSKNNNSKISIAVLYFDDHSPKSNIKWFCNGITEEITAKLSNINRLRVTSRTSVKQYRNSNKSIPEIAKDLDVDYIVEGSVTKDNNKVKITAQLINKKDEHIWFKEYNDNFDDSFAIQQNVAIQIAQQLKIDLSPEEVKIIEKYPTDNKEAYKLFLQAEYQKNLFNKIAFDKAIPLYKQAIALDSTFVDAYLGLAEIWQVGGIVWGSYDEQKAWKNFKKYLLKASSIDGANRRIEYELYFGYFYYEWDFEDMEKYYQKRLLNSNYDILTGIIQDYALKTGRYNEALLINERYIANSPSIIYVYAYKAEILMFLGKKDESLEILDRYNSLYSDDLFYFTLKNHLLCRWSCSDGYAYICEYE